MRGTGAAGMRRAFPWMWGQGGACRKLLIHGKRAITARRACGRSDGYDLSGHQAPKRRSRTGEPVLPPEDGLPGEVRAPSPEAEDPEARPSP